MTRLFAIVLMGGCLAVAAGCGSGVSELPPAKSTGTADEAARKKGMEESMKQMQNRGQRPPM